MAITDYRIEFFDRPLDEARAEGEARGEARGRAEGEARGEARSLLRVLAARGFDVPEDTRDQVMSCTDTTQLDLWLDKAATAKTLAEVFG
jgi:predicted transposase YdaD